MRGDGAPWREVMISGHSRDSSGAKISKSKGNAGASPEELVALHGADPLRYWAAGAALGQDSAYSEAAVSDGRRLVLKLWNAARLAVASLDRCSDDGTLSPRPIDARLMARLDDTIETSTAALDRREYAPALTAAERFLRRELCDDWLELAKARLRGEFGDDDRADARRTLRSALADSTRLLAPFLPHITEAVWLRLFARGDEQASVHRSGWPLPRGAAEGLDSEILGADMAMGALDCVRRAKTARGMSMAAPIASVIVEAPVNGDRTTAAFDATLRYVAAAMRIGVITHGESPFGAEFEESRGTKVVVMA